MNEGDLDVSQTQNSIGFNKQNKRKNTNHKPKKAPKIGALLGLTFFMGFTFLWVLRFLFMILNFRN